MIRRFLVQLLPLALLGGIFIGLDSRVGISDHGQLWIYSCRLRAGGSIGPNGVAGAGPVDNALAASIVGLRFGC